MKKINYAFKHVNHDNLVLVAYIVAVGIVMLPLNRSGFVLTLDMPWGPQIPKFVLSNNTWLLSWVLQALGTILTSALAQKLILFVVFLLAGLGAHRLASLSKLVKQYPLAAYTAGMLYIFNPFVYTRLLAGQWIVLLGYALLPWAIAALWRLTTRPSWSTAWRAIAWTAAVGLTSIHAVGFVILAALVMFIVAGRKNIKQRAKWAGVVLAGFVVLNSIWLVPAIAGKSKLAEQVGGFGQSQLQAFATTGTVADNVPLSALLLTGFWADQYDRYKLPSDLPTWWPAVILLAALIIIGIVVIIRRRDKLGISLLVLGVIAWWMGMGVGFAGSAPLAEWLTAHVPFYSGYREPHKWLMLLALLYAYAAAVGVGWIVSKLPVHKPTENPAEDAKPEDAPADWRPVVAGLAALLPLLLVPILLWGAGGQLRSAQYPADWYKVRKNLSYDTSGSPVVVLPWRMYMDLSFAGRVVANPAKHFFPGNMVTGNDAELKGVPAVDDDPIERLMNQRIMPAAEAGKLTNAGTLLCREGVRYIVMYEEADYELYDWVDRQPDIRKVYDGDGIRLYQTMPAAADKKECY